MVEWKDIHPSLTNELQWEWYNKKFSAEQTKEWIDIGLKPQDSGYAAWIRDEIELSYSEFNFTDDELFREQYQKYLEEQKKHDAEIESRKELSLLFQALALSLDLEVDILLSPKKNLAKLSDQELEKYLLEKRLDLEKYFVFNIQELTTEKARDDFGNVSRNGRVITNSLSEDLTKLALVRGWDDNISKNGEELKKNVLILVKANGAPPSMWECNDLDRQIKDKKELYILFEKDGGWVDWKGRINNVIDQSSIVSARIKPSLYLKNKPETLKLLRENDYNEQDHLKNLVKINTSLSNPQEVVRFKTWWSDYNIATVIDKEDYFQVFLLVYDNPLQEDKNKTSLEQKINLKQNLKLFPVESSCDKWGMYEPRGKNNDLESSQQEAEWLRGKLNGNNPILLVHPYCAFFHSFSELIKEPYVARIDLPCETKDSFEFVKKFPGDSHSRGSISAYKMVETKKIVPNQNPENYLKPLDVVWIKKVMAFKKYYHVGIYLGNNKVCHYSDPYSKKSTDSIMYTRITSWKDFIKGYDDISCEIIGHHAIIPFKHYWKIAKSLAWDEANSYGNRLYCLANNNCEHYVNSRIYGLKYSKQIEERPSETRENAHRQGIFKYEPKCYECRKGNINNGEIGNFKLKDDVSLSLNEKDNQRSQEIEREYKIEVPPKKPCSIM